MNRDAQAIHATQQSLFDDPVSKLYDAMDALKGEEVMLREMEKDYPQELQTLIDSKKDLEAQIKQEKDTFLTRLQKDDTYKLARTRKAELQIEVDDLKSKIKYEAINQSKNGALDLLIIVQGTPVKLQTESAINVFIDGKEI